MANVLEIPVLCSASSGMVTFARLLNIPFLLILMKQVLRRAIGAESAKQTYGQSNPLSFFHA